ncbi:DUF3365 domain-containing protein [candidate division KSB1 bacterium]|nr:DUF3365 domain-containing protein [candidate division KSB1 bacterium]
MRKTEPSVILTIFIVAAVSWTAVITVLYSWNVNNEVAQTSELSKIQSRAFFQEIVTTRYWNAIHGGVYVPITSNTQPNPYLDDPDRDVVTEDGLKLTKINPAYMTRQIGEIAAQKNSVWFHITSSKPIRPANAPDPWELVVLKSFTARSQEYSEFIDSGNGKKIFRYMAPLWVERPCLKCHAKQGYKVGDLRGGISVTLEADPILAIQRQVIKKLTFAYGSIWIIGLFGIVWGWRRLHWEEKKRREIIAQLHQALGEVKTLSGLLPICASCKKIRDDSGYWNQIETYIRDHSEAEFSHGICPECAKKLYPDLDINDD